MAYNIEYRLGEKTIKIPKEEIEKSMAILDLTESEAIQMYLEDEGYLENEEQEALERKAKENRITATIHEAKNEILKPKSQKERTKKENPTKEMIIREIAAVLPKFATDIEVLNVSKLISFKIGSDKFEIDLKQKRQPKK